MEAPNQLLIPVEQMRSTFTKILVKYGFDKLKANQIADIFTANSLDGVYTHGVNRFYNFIQYVKRDLVKKDAIPTCRHAFGGIEQWDGNLGPGVLNAVHSTERAIQLANKNGIGCVALGNTNHWMRGGYYGWQAAKKGVVFIGWTNTIANMPAWNATDSRLGNNPIVFALPYHDEAIVLDMAMSQFSFGTMEMAALKNEKLPINGGYDSQGQLTNDPHAIIQTRRVLPAGYWKGAGMALLLDILATLLSAGLSTNQITNRGREYGLSQVFICIDISKLPNYSVIGNTIDEIIKDYRSSIPENEQKKIVYPGERALQTRILNQENGIPVLESVWEKINQL